MKKRCFIHLCKHSYVARGVARVLYSNLVGQRGRKCVRIIVFCIGLPFFLLLMFLALSW